MSWNEFLFKFLKIAIILLKFTYFDIDYFLILYIFYLIFLIETLSNLKNPFLFIVLIKHLIVIKD